METKINKLIANTLFKLNGQLTKAQFKDIVKTMGWKMNYKKIHVVGTNGKGSISKYLNDNLINSGLKTSLFTSPHIFNFEERIKVNNIDIAFIDVQQHMIDLHLKFPKYNFGFFQLMFLSCLAHLETKIINVAIFESGIGAKKDVVNYLDFNTTIFTSISIDHEKILGSNLGKIAQDKSFAIKKNNTIFYPNTIDQKAKSILVKRAELMNNKNLNVLNIKTHNIHDQNQELVKFVLKKEFDIDATLFSMPIGRAQKISINNIDCYIDAGHNYDGIEKTLHYFKEKNINFDYYIISLSSDKDVKEIMKLFNNENTFIYQNKSERALTNFEYPQDFGKIYSLEQFIKKLNKKTLFIGSFYFIEEILRLIKYYVND